MIKKILKRCIMFYTHNTNQITTYETVSLQSKLQNCTLEKDVSISAGANISNTTIGYLSSIGRSTKVVHTDIGKYCAISWDTTINALGHPYNHLTVSAFPYVPHVGNFVKVRKQNYQRVLIKNDVWIGANSVIMPGVTIGNGAIIGAGAVVTKNVPDYAIVAGVPAKIIKYRFSEEIILRLLDLQWWDLDPKIIKEHIELWGDEFNGDALSKLEEICKY